MKRFHAVLMCLPACLLALAFGTASADDYNFENYASYKKNCDSIIFPDRSRTCSDMQTEMKKQCVPENECKLDKFTDVLKEYNDAKSKTVADADKEGLKTTIERLKRDLDDRQDKAKREAPRAEACYKQRIAIQDYFTVTSTLTKTAGDTQTKIREGLLAKLGAAQERQRGAKEKRDKDSRDDNARREWEAAVEETRNAEDGLRKFGELNGKDISRQVERLVTHYAEESKRHQEEISNHTNRANNCKSIASTSY